MPVSFCVISDVEFMFDELLSPQKSVIIRWQKSMADDDDEQIVEIVSSRVLGSARLGSA